MKAAERAAWQNPRVLTTLLLVFISGAFVGAVGMKFGLHPYLHHSTSGTLEDPKASQLFLDHCQRDLNLTPQQVTEMRHILDDYKFYYQNMQEQLDEVRATGKARIMELLNDDQRQKFKKLLLELK